MTHARPFLCGKLRRAACKLGTQFVREQSVTVSRCRRCGHELSNHSLHNSQHFSGLCRACYDQLSLPCPSCGRDLFLRRWSRHEHTRGLSAREFYRLIGATIRAEKNPPESPHQNGGRMDGLG